MTSIKLLKSMLLGLGLIVLMVSPIFSPASMNIQYPSAQAANSMAEIQLILNKLRMSMSSMKDFDELEKAGMPKKDVDRMRRGLIEKIRKLTKEAISSIRKI
ncbi:MAG: hypothetical protein Q9M11_04355 [Mariprofundaceae bacterium]|nr:hypothetical protein [Mariprofundaceae bacterium]